MLSSSQQTRQIKINREPRKKLPDKKNLPTLPPDKFQLLKDFLADQHDVSSLEEGEETDTV